MRKPVMHSIWLVLVLSFLSSNARAGTLGDLYYSITDGQVTITNCKQAAEGELVIPAEIEGLPVTRIRMWAFHRCSSLTSIIIPNSVTSIGDEAFRECSSLTSIAVASGNSKYKSLDGVLLSKDGREFLNYPAAKSGMDYTIPEGVTSIGNWAFHRCISLTSITIPEGVTSIGNAAFAGCESLTSITIPDSVTSIRDSAFEGCSSLTAVTIGKGVTSIRDSAFMGCSSLISITIPDSVTSIGFRAFMGCSSLTSIEVDSGNSKYKSLDGVLFSIDGKDLLVGLAGKSGGYAIPEGVTSIDRYAFFGCEKLTSITIPDSVTSIGSNAFQNCSSLISITIPDSVTSIGTRAFMGCSGLASINIPAAFHSQSEADRLKIGHLWPDGFFLPSSLPRKPPELSIRLAPVITVTGELDEAVTIEVADTADGPWAEWRTVVIGEEGTTEVDLDEGAEKRFYRVRE